MRISTSLGIAGRNCAIERNGDLLGGAVRGRAYGRGSSAAGAETRHLGLDAVRLGGAAVLHRHHHLHLRALLRLAHGERSGHGPGGLGLWHRRGGAWPSPSCRRCSARSPTRPARENRGSRFSRRSRSPVFACCGSPRPARTFSWSWLCFSLASVAAEFSTVFNDSMMPRLVPKAKSASISNIAWGLGYLGGMIALIFVVAFMAGSPETGKTIIGLDPIFGLDPKLGEDARATGPLSAALVFHLHPADVLLHAGRRQRPADQACCARGTGGTEVDAGRSTPSQRHLPLPDRPHDLSGRRQRAACARRRSLPRRCSAGRSPRSACSASSSTSSPSSVAWRAAASTHGSARKPW